MDRPTRRRVLATSATALAVGLAGCSSGKGGNSTKGGGNTVEMTDGLKYDPETITVSVGDTVTWKNTGSVGHTVTAYGDKIPDGATYFASGGYSSEEKARNAYTEDRGGNIPGGESYEHTFDTAGTYEYFCIPHETSGMKGTVKVEE